LSRTIDFKFSDEHQINDPHLISRLLENHQRASSAREKFGVRHPDASPVSHVDGERTEGACTMKGIKRFGLHDAILSTQLA